MCSVIKRSVFSVWCEVRTWALSCSTKESQPLLTEAKPGCYGDKERGKERERSEREIDKEGESVLLSLRCDPTLQLCEKNFFRVWRERAPPSPPPLGRGVTGLSRRQRSRQPQNRNDTKPKDAGLISRRASRCVVEPCRAQRGLKRLAKGALTAKVNQKKKWYSVSLGSFERGGLREGFEGA